MYKEEKIQVWEWVELFKKYLELWNIWGMSNLFREYTSWKMRVEVIKTSSHLFCDTDSFEYAIREWWKCRLQKSGTLVRSIWWFMSLVWTMIWMSITKESIRCQGERRCTKFKCNWAKRHQVKVLNQNIVFFQQIY